MQVSHILPPAKITLRRRRSRLQCLYADIRNIFDIRVGIVFTSWAITTSLCAPLHAQSSGINGALGLSSQLFDRGVAITPATPTLQGAVSWTSSNGWSFGLLGNTEVRSFGHVVEASAQVSRYWSLSDAWEMRASLLYYDYPDESHLRGFDRTETSVNWIYRDLLAFGLSEIRVIGSSVQPKGAADIDLRWPLAGNLSLSVGAGVAQSLVASHSHYSYGQSSVYRYGQAGLAWHKGPWRIEIELMTTDSGGQKQRSSFGASPWVGTISRSF